MDRYGYLSTSQEVMFISFSWDRSVEYSGILQSRSLWGFQHRVTTDQGFVNFQTVSRLYQLQQTLVWSLDKEKVTISIWVWRLAETDVPREAKFFELFRTGLAYNNVSIELVTRNQLYYNFWNSLRLRGVRQSSLAKSLGFREGGRISTVLGTWEKGFEMVWNPYCSRARRYHRGNRCCYRRRSSCWCTHRCRTVARRWGTLKRQATVNEGKGNFSRNIQKKLWKNIWEKKRSRQYARFPRTIKTPIMPYTLSQAIGRKRNSTGQLEQNKNVHRQVPIDSPRSSGRIPWESMVE